MLLALASPVPAAGEPLELALLPHQSVRTLMALYRPLSDYLRRELEREVVLVTAPDYRVLIQRTRERRYRFLVTAPHFARLAQRESGYLPLARVANGLTPLIVAARSRGITRLEALRGAVIATPDELAIVSMLGLQLLRDRGLEPGTHLTVRVYPSFASALLAARDGEADAAVSAEPALRQMPAALRDAMAIVERAPAVAPIMLLARDDVPAAERESVRDALLRFAQDPAGRAFFDRTGLGGYTRVHESDLQSMDPYLDRLRSMLGPP